MELLGSGQASERDCEGSSPWRCPSAPDLRLVPGGGFMLFLLTCENLSSQQLVFFIRYLYSWDSTDFPSTWNADTSPSELAFWHRLGLKMQGLLVEVNWGPLGICIAVGPTGISKKISNVLKLTLQQKYLLKFVYKKYLGWFTLQCLKLLILKEEKMYFNLRFVFHYLFRKSFFPPMLNYFSKCNGLILFPWVLLCIYSICIVKEMLSKYLRDYFSFPDSVRRM